MGGFPPTADGSLRGGRNVEVLVNEARISVSTSLPTGRNGSSSPKDTADKRFLA